MISIKNSLFLFVVLCVSSLGYSDSTPRAETKLCLTMIVKNESRVMERCLESVKDIVDYISICDTGSTDNTVEIIEQFMRKHGIPGIVHHHEWRNFGHNRTLSVQAAQEALEKNGFSLENTYLLLLDADMLLVVDDDFTKEGLKTNSYHVLQKSSSLSYYNTRLLRASLPWESRGVTHEYWECDLSEQKEILTTLVIDDRGDGGCKDDKYERDLRLLTQGLKDEPNNVRYMFYIAQTHKCLKNFADAIRCYKIRIAVGGWGEEVWYSKYMIAECYEEMEYWDHALTWYLEVYNYLPHRAEPLWKIARYYRYNGQHQLAHLLAKHGASIP